MKCLYEVLGVARDADDETIRKVYRKQALVWHPGKQLAAALSACAQAANGILELRTSV